MQDLLAKGYDSAVNLDHPVPVHTTYFTASADADGKVTTFADVYGLDKKVAPVVGRTPPESQQDIEEVADRSPRPRQARATPARRKRPARSKACSTPRDSHAWKIGSRGCLGGFGLSFLLRYS